MVDVGAAQALVKLAGQFDARAGDVSCDDVVTLKR
jgi:hypothetical protein